MKALRMDKLIAASLVVAMLTLQGTAAFLMPVSTRPMLPPSCTNTRRSRHQLFVEIPKFNLFDAFDSLTKLKKASSINESVKNSLLAICYSDDDVATKRTKVEAMLEAVTTASPLAATSASPKLSRGWEAIWTTEKEINLFLDQGWASNIYQVINGESRTIENSIPFVNERGSLTVKGIITPSKERRTEFEFTAATLTIANPWNAKQKFQISLPPVGKGWFDTLYLDDTLRVDINSRNDILVCRPVL